MEGATNLCVGMASNDPITSKGAESCQTGEGHARRGEFRGVEVATDGSLKMMEHRWKAK